MLHPVTFRTLAIAACGWLLACDASALALGRARGAVLVGRPLDVSVPVTLDSNDGEAPCAEAELFHGDTRVAGAPAVRFERSGPLEGVLRITSAVPVDEPAVTLFLRVGCRQSVTRRFVLLSELPSAAEAAAATAVPARPSAPAQAPAGTAPAAAPRTAAPARPRGRDAEPATRPARAPARQAPAAAPAARSPGPRPEVAEPRPPQSRLRLDLLDPAAERDPTLRLTVELATAVAAEPQARAAAAATWQALRRTPEEAVQEGLRLQTLERELQALRGVSQQNAAALARMREAVQRTGGGPQDLLLIGGLLAALAALAGWLFWQSRRVAQRGTELWPGFEEPAASGPNQTPATAPRPVGGSTATPDSDRPKVGAAAAEAIKPVAPGPGVLPSAEFQPSLGGTVRMAGVQELIDVHDTADFFLALGQHEQAVAVLEAHVHDQVETSALVWMDLLQLYHSLGRRDDYERLRAEFRQRFAVQVRDFDHFDQPTNSLENYGRALSRIVALWSSPRVLSVIEEALFRKPGLPGAEPFSLEAYRELVLLYNIAREVAPRDTDGAMEYQPTDFPHTSMQPLNALDLPSGSTSGGEGTGTEAHVVMGNASEKEERDRDLLLIPPASPRIGLDIDLDNAGRDPLDAGAAARRGLLFDADRPLANQQTDRPGPAAPTQDVQSRDLPPLDFDLNDSNEAGTRGRKQKS